MKINTFLFFGTIMLALGFLCFVKGNYETATINLILGVIDLMIYFAEKKGKNI